MKPGRIIKYLFTLVLLLLLQHTPASGQENPDFNQQIWLDFNPKVLLGSSKVMLYGGLGYRTIVQSNWDRYYLNIGLNYSPFIHNDSRSPAIQCLQLHAGIGDYYTRSLENTNLNEIRTYVGVRLRWPSFKRVAFSHYVRFEQRFERFQNSNAHEFTPRLRYRLSAKFRFLKTTISDLYIPLHFEIFMSKGDGFYFNDVSRLTPGIGYDFTDQFATELHLSYHFSRNSGDDSFQNNELVYRLRVYYTF